MKVLHVVPAVFSSEGNLGGAERYALELARHMRGQVDVRLVAYGKEPRILQLTGMPVEVIRGWPVRGNQFNSVGPGVLAPARWADVIHCHQHHILSSSLLALFGRVTCRPVVATDHGGGGFDLSSYVNTNRLFAAHLHVSEFSRREARHTGAELTRVVYAGVDTERFRPGVWKQKRDRVLFVGRVLPHKRVDVLIESLPADLRLDVIGPLSDERYAADLLRLARGRNVTFHGPVDEPTLERAYRASLCVVLPSDYEDLYGGRTEVPELLGQVLLEGMASGIPAICSDAGAMTEVVQHGATGLVCKRRDPEALRSALERLAADQAYAERLGAQGRAHVQREFTWQAVAMRCIEVYRELVPTARARRRSRLGGFS